MELRYVFVADRGEMTRGMPTGYAAVPMIGHFAPSDGRPPVWPDPEGGVRGYAFSPLYRSAPRAAREDSRLYELLVVVDSLRAASVRERELATVEIQNKLKRYTAGGTSEHGDPGNRSRSRQGMSAGDPSSLALLGMTKRVLRFSG